MLVELNITSKLLLASGVLAKLNLANICIFLSLVGGSLLKATIKSKDA